MKNYYSDMDYENIPSTKHFYGNGYRYEKGIEPSNGITNVSIDSIIDAYNDYRLSLEF